MIEKEFCKLMTTTLHNYEKLFANPMKEANKWKSYGNACKICELTISCIGCPLYPCDVGDTHLEDGIIDTSDIEGAATYVNLSATCEELTNRYNNTEYEERVKDVVKAAKERYKWLINKIGKSGYEYR